MLKRRSGQKYFGNVLLCIPEGYLYEIIGYIREIYARSGWILNAITIDRFRSIFERCVVYAWSEVSKM